MPSPLQSIVTSPLLHFLIIGTLLFVVFEWVEDEGTPSAERIEIDQYELARLAALWQAQWRRPPSREELSELVADRVREEVFYREALALGLDEGDVLVRRRLAQKLELALDDVAALPAPPEEALRRIFREQKSEFVDEAVISFEHRFFRVEGEGGQPVEHVRSAIARLEAGNPVADDPFHAPKRLNQVPRSRIARVFGGEFAASLERHMAHRGERQRWFGPVRSAYGLHAVRLLRFSAGEALPFERAREEILEDWRRERQAALTRQRYEEMRARYRLDVAPFTTVEHLLAP